MIHDLYTIMRSCSDNQLKADYIEKELKYYGFEPVGLGTNIFTMSNPVYPGVVFKIALDDCGIADNFNDCILQDVVPRYVKVFCKTSIFNCICPTARRVTDSATDDVDQTADPCTVKGAEQTFPDRRSISKHVLELYHRSRWKVPDSRWFRFISSSSNQR